MSQPLKPRTVLHLPKVRMLSRGGRASGLRITNVRSIMPPNPETVKKQEAEKSRAEAEKLRAEPPNPKKMKKQESQLREQSKMKEQESEMVIVDVDSCSSESTEVKKEIATRSRTCAYPGYECWGTVVTGRQYCASHILQDATAPYVQCAHSYANGDRCPMPAPNHDPRDAPLCFEHARNALLSRQRAAAPPPPVISTETLLNQLQHYVKPERPRTTSCASSVSVVSDPSEPEQISPIAVDPFKQMDATAINAAHSASILECASCSDSEGETITLGRGGSCRMMDCNSDSEERGHAEDSPLWRAGVFTAEEAVTETHSVLRQLQSAYKRQMEHLKHMLHAARLNYLRELKLEKEQYCSINSQARSGPLNVRERRQLRKLKAYAGYHRRHGGEAMLQRKLLKKRAKLNDNNANRPLPSLARCTYVEETARCTNQTIPASKHCAKHILHDRNQVLFAACSDIRGVDGCKEPVAKLPLPSDACRYHTDPPTYTVFTLKKDDTDSETDSQTSFAQLTDDEVTHLPREVTHLPREATHLPREATHLPREATHLPREAFQPIEAPQLEASEHTDP